MNNQLGDAIKTIQAHDNRIGVVERTFTNLPCVRKGFSCPTHEQAE